MLAKKKSQMAAFKAITGEVEGPVGLEDEL